MPDVARLALQPELESDLEHLRAETHRLLATAASLDDAALRKPSLCAGWSRAHVLSHVTRNARAMLNLVATVQGTPTPMYPSSAARAADIEAGATQDGAALVAELCEASETLAVALAGLDETALAATAQAGSGPLRGDQLARHRLREVVWHHVDLAAGYDFTDASADDVRRWWGEVVDDLRSDADSPSMTLRTDERDVVAVGDGSPTISGSRAGLLLWLVRGVADGVDAPSPDQLPSLDTSEDPQ